MRLTVKTLEKHGASALLINFVKMYGLDKYRLSDLDISGELMGHYNFKWLDNLKHYTFDHFGNELCVGDGQYFKHEYDEHDRMVRSTCPGGFIDEWEYDDNGNILIHRDNGGKTFYYEYDDEGNLISPTIVDSSNYIKETVNKDGLTTAQFFTNSDQWWIYRLDDEGNYLSYSDNQGYHHRMNNATDDVLCRVYKDDIVALEIKLK